MYLKYKYLKYKKLVKTPGFLTAQSKYDVCPFRLSSMDVLSFRHLFTRLFRLVSIYILFVFWSGFYDFVKVQIKREQTCYFKIKSILVI